MLALLLAGGGTLAASKVATGYALAWPVHAWNAAVLGSAPSLLIGVKPIQPFTQHEVRAVLLGQDQSAKSEWALARSFATGSRGLGQDLCLAKFFYKAWLRNPETETLRQSDHSFVESVQKIVKTYDNQPTASCSIKIARGPEIPLSSMVQISGHPERAVTAFGHLEP